MKNFLSRIGWLSSGYAFALLVCVLNFVHGSNNFNQKIEVIPELPIEVLYEIFRHSIGSFSTLAQVSTQWSDLVRAVAKKATVEDCRKTSQKAKIILSAKLEMALPKLMIQLNETEDLSEYDKFVCELSAEIYQIYTAFSSLGFSSKCLQSFSEDIIKGFIEVMNNVELFYMWSCPHILFTLPRDLIMDLFFKKLNLKVSTLANSGRDRAIVMQWADTYINAIRTLKASGVSQQDLINLGEGVFNALLLESKISEPAIHFLLWCRRHCYVYFPRQDGYGIVKRKYALGSYEALPCLTEELSKLYVGVQNLRPKELESSERDSMYIYARMKLQKEQDGVLWAMNDLHELLGSCEDKTLVSELFVKDAIDYSQNDLLEQLWRKSEIPEIQSIIDYMIGLYGSEEQKSLIDDLKTGC